MVFGSKYKLKQVDNLKLHIDGDEIERVTTFKYLGMMLDCELNFESHVSYIYRKACCKLTLLRKTRICMNSKVANQLYKSLILPQIDYCDVVYMVASKSSLVDLQKIQNICCRIILKTDNRTHIADMNKKLYLIPLNERRETHLSQICHKAVYDEPKHSLHKFFNRIQNRNNRNTRWRNQMHMLVPDRRSNKGRLGIAYRGPMHWNKLSNELKLIRNHNTFKTNLYKKFTMLWDTHPT